MSAPMRRMGRTRPWGLVVAALLMACSAEVQFTSTSEDARAKPSQRPTSSNSDAVPNDDHSSVDPQTPNVPDTPVAEPEASEPELPDEPSVNPPLDPPVSNPVNPPVTVTLERHFPAARIEAMNVTFLPEYRITRQDVTLTELPPSTQTRTQIMRTAVTDQFKQGKDAAAFGPETYAISESGKLDLLVVVDDSTSMEDEQRNLASKLDSLVSKLGNTDWQIAVVTTSDPCLRNNGRPIKKNDPDPAGDFQTAVIVPLDNTVIEKGFPMAIKALKGECQGVTNPWIRDGSAIGILIVSDEDNCGSHAGEGCPGEEGETPQQMLDFLAGLRPAGMARVYGLIDGANQCSSAYRAPKYRAVIEQTGGTWGKICDTNYTQTLQAISDNVSRIVKHEFELTHVPEAGTLHVVVDGEILTDGYTLDGKKLTLEDPRDTQVTLQVSYAYGAVPKYDRFALSQTPDAATMAVSVNGVPLSSADYEYDMTTREVVFGALPPDDAALTVTYRRDEALPTHFTYSTANMLGEPLAVTVGGVAVQDYSFDAVSGTLELATTPRDGQEVQIRHRTLSGRVTRYASVLADPGDAHRVSATDRDSGETIEVILDGADLVFKGDDVVQGRQIRVDYELGYAAGDLSYALGQVPVDGTVQVTAARDPTACAGSVRIIGDVVHFDCPDQDVGEITISYQAVAERYETFALGQPVPKDATWTVLVDGQEIKNYSVAGDTVRIPLGLLGARSQVTVRVSYLSR